MHSNRSQRQNCRGGIRVGVVLHLFSHLKSISSELHVRLIDMDDTGKIKLLKEGHRGGVRKVTWHPTAPLLVRAKNKSYSNPRLLTTSQLPDNLRL
jgi:hypothetical protein